MSDMTDTGTEARDTAPAEAAALRRRAAIAARAP